MSQIKTHRRVGNLTDNHELPSSLKSGTLRQKLSLSELNNTHATFNNS